MSGPPFRYRAGGAVSGCSGTIGWLSLWAAFAPSAFFLAGVFYGKWLQRRIDRAEPPKEGR